MEKVRAKKKKLKISKARASTYSKINGKMNKKDPQRDQITISSSKDSEYQL